MFSEFAAANDANTWATDGPIEWGTPFFKSQSQSSLAELNDWK